MILSYEFRKTFRTPSILLSPTKKLVGSPSHLQQIEFHLFSFKKFNHGVDQNLVLSK